MIGDSGSVKSCVIKAVKLHIFIRVEIYFFIISH